jgi:hypothetical protein
MQTPKRFGLSICAIAVALVGLLFAPRQAQADAAADAIQSLDSWLTKPSAERGKLAEQAFASVPLSKDQAATARAMLWKDHVKLIHAEREKEWKDEAITIGEHTLRLKERTFGTKPANGWNLYISMHGGGNAAPRVNDQQWDNQIKLYSPKDSLYIAPRAPTNTWNLWHEAHIDDLFNRLIEDAIVLGDVDPNHVYIMGYSAGGDGVYQLAPRMADRWAAAAMMAGHPNDASPLSLRNIGFTLHVGGKDTAYNRNKVAEKWGIDLDALATEDPGGYPHKLQIHQDRPHWMNREDAVAVDWMAGFTRNPVPDKVVWKQSTVTHDRFYWLAVPAGEAKAGALVTVKRDKQKFEIEKAEDVANVKIMLNDAMVDLSQPIVVSMKGKTVFNGQALRTIANLDGTLEGRGDPDQVFDASVTVRTNGTD